MTADLLRIAIATSIVLAVAAIHPRAASGQDQPPRIGPFVIDVRGTSPKFPDDAQLAESRGLERRRAAGPRPGARRRRASLPVQVARHHVRRRRADDLRAALRRARWCRTAWRSRARSRRGSRRSRRSCRSTSATATAGATSAAASARACGRLCPTAQQPLPADEERLTTINYGGGARWFAKPHLAFTFDVRFHEIDPGTPQGGLPGSPRTDHADHRGGRLDEVAALFLNS